MRVMIFVKATKDSEKGLPPDPKMFEAMGRYNDELMKAGLLVSQEQLGGLKPTSHAKRIRFDGEKRNVIDGPFGGDANEFVAGFWIWEVKDMDEAVAWVKRCPNPMAGASEIEIRPFFEMEDFAEWGVDLSAA